ncbi:2-hydroxyglutaryl-CoA dehydratase [Clostridia bacterium]|nr:2-hydroxyglutaryl-CoA dehydratase [Clostridia bacterium]
MFTEEMKKEYTILIPDMLPIHFQLFTAIFAHWGYNSELLREDGREVVDEGLKNVHNDTCYPALLVIGQFLNALKSGKYDVNKTALLLTQTGGGCRASNYIALLRKALQKEFPQVPVLSLNFSGLESDSSFKINPPMFLALLNAIIYGDLLMSLYNQCKPYEIIDGKTDKKLEYWEKVLAHNFKNGRFLSRKNIYKAILDDFASVERSKEKKIRVGIVGEIYVKYSPLANNHLEEFLISENCEPVVPSLLEFVMYCTVCALMNGKIYGYKDKKTIANEIAYQVVYRKQKELIKQMKSHGEFDAPHDFEELRKAADKYISQGVTMGEGWLITAEMATLAEHGVKNIVCAQPFGCLPNHIVGKGMVRSIKNAYPDVNIVPIDYDPGATKVNQENRIKLMLSNAVL